MSAQTWSEKRPAAESLVCPHCGTRGRVSGHWTKVKRGVSGGKLVAAVLTMGLSVLVVGLSRKQPAMQMLCGACGMRWTVD